MAEGYTITHPQELRNGDVVVRIAWVSASDGTCSIPIDGTDNDDEFAIIFGKFLKTMRTIPSGTAAPTADYDIVINDTDSVDLLGGAGADRAADATEEVHCIANSIKWARLIHTDLDIEITNAGDTKAGTIVLHFSDDRTML
jgi:hypothetical protein